MPETEVTSSAETAPKPMPVVRAATVTDIVAAVEAGLRDFRAAPLHGVAFGLFYAVGGFVLLEMSTHAGWLWVAFPLATGFALVGPFVAVGLYEISRRLGAGEPVTFGGIAASIFSAGRRELGWMALVSMFAFVIWMYQARLMFALYFGLGTGSGLTLWQLLFTTQAGWGFLAIGTAWGAVLSVVVFTLTVVSFPILLDRDVDFITAMITSVKAVVASPVVMVGWGLITAALILIAMAPYFLGLIVVLPVLGHATWHLYKRVVEPAA